MGTSPGDTGHVPWHIYHRDMSRLNGAFDNFNGRLDKIDDHVDRIEQLFEDDQRRRLEERLEQAEARKKGRRVFWYGIATAVVGSTLGSAIIVLATIF